MKFGGGNPAHFIRKRFTDEQIKELLEIRWWDWNATKIEKEADCFEDIETFIRHAKES